MNLNLLRKTIGDRWRSFTVYLGGILAYVLMLCALFPVVQKMTGIQEFLGEYPEALTRFFGVEKLDITSLNGFMVVEFLGVMWVIIVAAFVISFARSQVAGEVKDGPLEFLLAQPIERWKILTGQGTVLLTGTILLVGSTFLGVFIFGAAFGISVAYSGYLSLMPIGCALFIAVAGYSLLFSTVFNNPKKAVMASAALTLVFYLVHFAGAYSSVMEKIDIISIFHYYNPLKVLDSGTVPVRDVLVLLGAGLVFFLLAIWVFRRKDIAL